MHIIKNLFLGTAIVFLSLGLLIGCNSGGNDGSGVLNIQITDAPFPFELVEKAEVTIDKIEIHISNSPTETSGFIVLSETEQTFDLLQLQGGVTATLLNTSLPEGTYGQIRLRVISGKVTLTDGKEFPLTVPSGDRTGIKIVPIPAIVVQEGLTTDLMLDFDVGRSFIPIPSASTLTKVDQITEFKFKPVIRVVNRSSVGSISGTIRSDSGTPENLTDDLPLDDATVIASHQDDNEIASTSSQSDGSYALLGLPKGTYKITVSRNGFLEATQTEIDVLVGDDTSGVDFTLAKQQ